MAIDIYMQISNPSIAGHVTRNNVGGLFAIGSLSFGGVAPSGTNATLTQVTVTLSMDSATALMQSMVQQSTHDVVFTLYRTSDPVATVYQKFVLAKSRITMLQESANTGDTLPALELSFSFLALTVTEEDSTVAFQFGQV